MITDIEEFNKGTNSMESQENVEHKGEIKTLDFSFIHKKTEKLSSAVYMLTGFFRDEEPMKWKLRTLAGFLVSNSIRLSDESFSSERTKRELQTNIIEIRSLLNISSSSNLISPMNFSIVDKEFRSLLTALGLSENVDGKGVLSFENNYFFVKPSLQIESKAPLRNFVPEKTIEPVSSREGITELLPRINTHSFQGLDSKDAKEERQKEPKLKEFGAVAVKKNARQSVIIGLLKRKKEIMIKDVSPLIQGVSEKTIQRELLSMVGDGILKKEGEKRWSKYSLAD
ncbi:hypothetical protein KW790_01865 [Candidatus Parcubacteria bacterium]|nr:hypothetical protein [Candidatus Parcubacteria bacterium]